MRKSKSKFKFYIIATVVFSISFFVVAQAFAAEIFFETKTQKMARGQQFDVKIFINTDGENINAIEGKIIFPADKLVLKETQDGNSIINFWIEQPEFKNGKILFSGIVPGGFNGQRGLIFSTTFWAQKEGNSTIEFNDIKTLLNDGKGTLANTVISNLKLVISEQIPAFSPSTAEIKDTDVPEAFKPIIASDPAIFDGKYFLVFATQDKGSGIDHYEVREGGKPFIVAESPYLLQNQNLSEKIVVKAIDNNDNERIGTLASQKMLLWYKNYWILAILIAIGFIIVETVWRKILWQNLRK